ncbi:MAG: S9 family peptidase [Sphingomonas sp.]|nr:S9 family peptidase [Sphingomonas sp.]
MARIFALLALMLCMTGESRLMAAPPPLEVYGSLPQFERAAMSASGDRIAMIAVLGEARRLVIIDRDGKLLAATNVGDAKVRRIAWAGDDRVLVWITATVDLGIGFTASKAELGNVIVIPVNGKPWTIFQGVGTVTGGVRGFYGLLPRNGTYYGYFGGITLTRGADQTLFLKDTSPELYEVNLSTGKTRRIARRVDSDTNHRDWVVNPDGSVAATLDHERANGKWSIRNIAGRTIASGKNPLGGISLVGIGSKADTIIYAQDDETSGRTEWFELPSAGGVATPALGDLRTQSSFFDDNSGQLSGYVTEADVPEAHFFDARREKVMRGTHRAFPGLNVTFWGANQAFDRLLVETNGAGDAGTWWTVDIKTGNADILGSTYAVRGADVGPMRMFAYKAADGLALSGVLTLPPHGDARDLPVVVMPHGGPAARDYPAFDWWAQALAAHGYAVFQPNFRGSTGYGADFEKSGHGEWGRKMQSDISDGLAELVRQRIVDGKRACIMGASYGGYAALAGVTLQQGLYRCAISVGGVADIGRMIATDLIVSGEDKTLGRALKDELGSGRDLKQVSPLALAGRADAPVLLIYGKDDTVVAPQQSMSMGNALRRAGKPVETVVLDKEDHWLSKGKTRLDMLKAAVAFVERLNPADPPPHAP